jgi:hypothetical protein
VTASRAARAPRRQAGRAQVDRDADVETGPLERPDLLQRAVEHERRQRAREAALLDEREELDRAQQQP